MILSLFALLLSVMNSPQANAASRSVFCASRESIAASVEDCNDNDYYADAGVTCLDKIEKLVQTKAAQSVGTLQALGDKYVGKSKTKQQSTENGAQVDYASTVATLGLLILEAKQARSEIDAYQDQLVFPEEIGLTDGGEAEPQEVLEANQCYAENKQTLGSVVSDVDKMIGDLQAAQDKTKALQASSGGNESALGGGPQGKQAADVKAAGHGKNGPPKKDGQSNVTGVQKALNDDQKAKPIESQPSH